jgi:hypothetical protein
VAQGVRRLIVDEKTMEFLRIMREQSRGTNSREVNSHKAARELDMAPRYREYKDRLAELMWAKYLHPHPNPRLYRRGVHLITARGISVADGQPPTKQPTPRNGVSLGDLAPQASDTARRPQSWWRRMFGRW